MARDWVEYYKKNKKVRRSQSTVYYQKNRDRIREHRRNKRKLDPINHMLHQAKDRAKKRGLEFSLARQDVQIPTHCPVLGIPLSVSAGRHSDNSPTLDRIDNDRGYVKGNVGVISFRANRFKSNASVEELEALVIYLRKSAK